MKIFVSMKVLRGDTDLERLVLLISDVIQQTGHEPFVAVQEIAALGFETAKDFMPFVRRQAQTSDLMIVIYHPELRGGLIELGLAYAGSIPIWLCCKPGEKVSNSALGCADLTVEYTGLEDLQKQLMVHLRLVECRKKL